MKYHVIKMDLHKANNEASEGTMALNLARGLAECSQAAYIRDELGYDKEAISYLRTAYNSLSEARELVLQTMITMELALEETDSE